MTTLAIWIWVPAAYLAAAGVLSYGYLRFADAGDRPLGTEFRTAATP